jgi:hypothetical protein
MEFKVKTMARAKEICFVLGLIMGETAAMALPPQIAVPAEEDKIKAFPA